MSKLALWLINFVDGWKSVLGYILLQIPQLNTYPMLLGALQKVIEDPNEQNIAAAIAQAVLTIGVIDRIRKNLFGK